MRRPALAAVLLLALVVRSAFAGGGPAETVVLVNTASADSKRVAEHYVKARGIPRRQVCEVTCDTGLETPMDAFVKTVVDPLREFLCAPGLEDRCRFVVMTQGMPIVASTPGGAVSTAAALSLLDTSVCGQPQNGLPLFKHAYTAGSIQAGAPRVAVEGRYLLVTALISTTADEAIALIDRSVASDGTAPAGARFVFQEASGAAGVRDASYDRARKELEAAGFATEHAPVGADAVKDRDRVMGYISGGGYSALTVPGVNSNRYLPGAICDMLQSYGAVPVNFDADPKNDQQFPVTHMIRAGITGVHGAVAEPYNIAFPDVGLFKPYVEGFTLAETFHQRMPYAYWMNLTIGDPLCAPYAKRPVATLRAKVPWEGIVQATVSAPGAVRIDVYRDARLLGSVAGEGGTISIDTSSWRSDVIHELLVEATGAGPAEPRGWTTVEVTSRKGGPRAHDAGSGDGWQMCESLLAEAPSTVRAGETFTVKATAADVRDAPLTQWRGRVDLRSAVPPVRWSHVHATTPSTEMTARFTKVGDYELRVTADGGTRPCEATLRVHVDAGPLHHATTPLSTFPLCQESDMEVVLEDEFGNRATDYGGTIGLAVPSDPFAQLPLPLVISPAQRGRGVLRGVLLTHSGGTGLVFTDAGGKVVSMANEGVKVDAAPIRPWLAAGPGPAKELFSGDVTASATGDGSVAAKMLLRRRIGVDALPMPEGSPKPGEAAVFVTWIESLGATKARLLAAGPGRVRVLLDGKEIFDGQPKVADAKGKREPVAEMNLAPGTHRLAIVAETRGPGAASFEIDDGKGQYPTALRIRARSGVVPKSFVVSGRVVSGPGSAGVVGAKVTSKTADGKERAATSAADGTWWIDGLASGEIVVKVSHGSREFVDPERRLTIGDANVVDVNFGTPGAIQTGGK